MLFDQVQDHTQAHILYGCVPVFLEQGLNGFVWYLWEGKKSSFKVVNFILNSLLHFLIPLHRKKMAYN